MEEQMIQNFNLYFPVFGDRVVSYRAISDTDLIIEYASGKVELYDDLYHTITLISKNNEPINERIYRRELGRRLTKTLLSKRMTQDELAHALDISQATVSNYLSGRRQPTPYMLHRMAQVLGCSIDDLIFSI